tara:strand:- start:712 stop:2121 length:1410 start_codon:yes stop_codon:yes gene_type:complete
MTKSRLVLIGNQARTEFFKRVADYVDHKHVRISWIVVNADQRDELLKSYPAEDVLYLPLSTPLKSDSEDLKINDLLFCDRRLKYIKETGRTYLRAIQAPIKEFLNDEIPTLLVGELTYSYELVAYRLTQKVLPHCRWVSIFHTRTPPNHFAFYEDESFSREVWPVPNDIPKLEECGQDNGSYSYQELNRNISRHFNSRDFVFGKIVRFLSKDGFDAEDPTLKSNGRWEKLRKNVPFFLNRITYKWIRKCSIEEIRSTRGRTVIYPLHLQPEANIDTCGRYWDNQAETILKIWRQLGPEDTLFIKEHPVAIGNRGMLWYRRLLNYPNIKLLHHQCAPSQIIREVDYVFTVAGTMGMEAALAGGRVLCLAPTSYDRLENVVSPTIADFRRYGTIDDLYNGLRAEKRDGWSLDRYRQHMQRYAYPGDGAGDLNANPESWLPSNLQRVAWGLSHVLSQLHVPDEKATECALGT